MNFRERALALFPAGSNGEYGIPAELVPVFLEAGPTPNPGGIPIGGQTKVTLPNDHLQYAITWYILAVALAVIYVVYHLKLGKVAET